MTVMLIQDFYVYNWLMLEDIIIKQGREKSKTEKL